MNLSVKEKQDLLKINNLKEALETLRFMNIELQKLELKNDIQSKVRFDLDQTNISLTTDENHSRRIRWCFSEEEMERCLQNQKTKWDEKTQKNFEKIVKMRRMNPQAPDFGIQRNYLSFY
jgi:ATP-dependent Lon protease